MNLFTKSISFLKEVKLEIKKVNWPSKEETLKHTLIVIGASMAVAGFLGGFDKLFQFLLEKFVL